MGMTTLCGTVLLLNEEATGFDARIILQELALEFAQADLSSADRWPVHPIPQTATVSL